MFPLFETLCIRNGVPQNLEWHQKRMNASAMAVLGKQTILQLADEIIVPPTYASGTIRCRVEYNLEDMKLTFHPYRPVEIKSLRLINADKLDYLYKFTDRRALEEGYALRNGCDDVLFVKNGLITDTTIANVILWDGSQWLTPASPLLPGTCRARLLAQRKISEADIRVEDLSYFTKFQLINAFRDLEDENGIEIEKIVKE
jgi:4-amino-4-deoxychorismate lyase